MSKVKQVTLKDPKSLTVSLLDIVGNLKGYKFVELDAAQLARPLPDVDAAAVNNNYAAQAGLDPVNGTILAVREEDKDKPWVRQLIRLPLRAGEGVRAAALQGRLRRRLVSRPCNGRRRGAVRRTARAGPQV
ncbi:MetQ/NlpA family ABC transporter substrate-binding protein [Azospirillum sp. TSO22-1]|uniref:MetQ/NlpA family ABC transporter substrate-binding protein n=1 Tax=Azospirillum sp. TSO22-1 TaxID=716789 RepID=UPI0018EE5414|nr:MetQ/NlpA family ABC transporter substrate-binding protein [Azospirillum sp. TSO22-1]